MSVVQCSARRRIYKPYSVCVYIQLTWRIQYGTGQKGGVEWSGEGKSTRITHQVGFVARLLADDDVRFG